MNSQKFSPGIVLLAKSFGILQFKREDSYFNKFLSIIICLPVILTYIYMIYMNAFEIISLDYMIYTKLLKVINTLYLLLTSCAIIFKYSYYITKSQEIWSVLERIRNLTAPLKVGGRIYQNSWRSWLIFATVSLGVFLLDSEGVFGSKINLPMEWTIFHSLYQQHIFVELYVIGTFLEELLKAYADVNRKIESLSCTKSGKCGNFSLRKWNLLSRRQLLRQEVDCLCKRSNGVFIPGLAVTILTELYLLVATCHMCFLNFFIGYQTQKYNGVLLSWMVFLMLVKTGYILYFINMWMAIMNEAQKTVTHIHDIWNNLATQNEITRNAKHLQLIALQLYNSKLFFTAYGFFALDWTLLHRIVSAVATYVVILIQFEISSMAKHNNSVYNLSTQVYDV